MAEKSGFVSFALSSATSHIDHSESLAREETLQVRAVSLDDWASGKKFLVALAKIDVEGAETMALRGAIHLLRTHQPLILCEVLSDEAGLGVMSALPAGYLFYHIDENSGLSAKPVVDRKLWRNKNWLFVHESKIHLLADLV